MRYLRYGAGWLGCAWEERDRSDLSAIHHQLERARRPAQLRPVLRVPRAADAGRIGGLPCPQSAAGRAAPAAAADTGEPGVQPDPASLRQAEYGAVLRAADWASARSAVHLQGRSRDRQFPARPER